jgi:hypothetical protein
MSEEKTTEADTPESLKADIGTNDCPICGGEAEPGYIEAGHNGPIIPCYWCNRTEWVKSLRCEERRHDH